MVGAVNKEHTINLFIILYNNKAVNKSLLMNYIELGKEFFHILFLLVDLIIRSYTILPIC